MLGLITDRTQENVDYLASLNQKGWAKMTPYERAMWTGDPLTAADFGYREPVNILPNSVYCSDNVSVLFRNKYFVVTGTGTATVVIGAADDFIGKDVTFSAGAIAGSGHLELVWYNSEDDFTEAGCTLMTGYSVTTTLDAKPETWDYLAMRIYAQGTVTYHEVMLELGNIRHDYVPYTPILPTMATKGAYNYSDLNRVEMVVAELSERWRLGRITKTDWTMWDVPTVSDMVRYRGNLAVIGIEQFGRDVISEVPYDLSKMTYTHANRIEEFLLSVSELEV